MTYLAPDKLIVFAKKPPLATVELPSKETGYTHNHYKINRLILAYLGFISTPTPTASCDSSVNKM